MHFRYHPNAALTKLIDRVGGIKKLAKLLGISATAIYKWEEVPYLRACQIQVITDGEFPANDFIKDKTTEEEHS